MLQGYPFAVCSSVFLETLKDPSSLTFLEVTVLVFLHGKNPSSGYKIPGLSFSHVYKIKNFIVNPRLAFSLLGI